MPSKGHTSSSATSSFSTQSKPKSKSKTSKPDEASKEKRREHRRQSNIASANRSRERLKNEHNWMHIQMSENEDRMHNLEKRVAELTAELAAPPRRKSTQPAPRDDLANADRPAWFGDAF